MVLFQHHPTRALALLLVGLTIIGTACDERTSSGTKAGDLGQGQFRYLCLGANDTACKPGESSPEVFPALIAAGAEFGLNYETEEGKGNILPDTPVTNSFERTNRGFRALRPGVAAIIVRSSLSGGAVVDFTHLKVLGVSSLRFVADDGTAPRISIKQGEELALMAVPRGSDGSDLAGQVSCSWTSSATDTLSLSLASPTSRMTFKGNKPGKATITAELVGTSNVATTTIDIEVTP